MPGGAGKAATSSGTAADPLASVITQVQPGQASGAGASFVGRSGTGPARPTRVAKKVAVQQTQQPQPQTGTQPAAMPSSSEPLRRKKKKRASRPTEGEGGQAVATTTSEAMADPLGADAATTSGTSSGIAGSSAGRAAPALTGLSATFPPASSPEGQSQAGPGADIATNPGVAGIGETGVAATMQESDPRQSTEQDLTQAGEKLQQTSPEEAKSLATAASPSAAPATSSGAGVSPTGAVASGSSRSPITRPTTEASHPGPTANAAQKSPPIKQQRKPSVIKKLIALLTCSSMSVEDNGEKANLTASTSRQPVSKEGSNIEMKERRGAGKVEGPAASTALSQTSAKDARPKTNRVDGSKASSAKQLQEQQRSQRNASKLTIPPGKAALAAGATGGVVGGATLAATHHHSRRGSSSARNSLESRSETGVIAPPPGTLTPGGGTQLSREETGDVMSGAVVPPGSAFVTIPSGSAGGSATPTPSKRGGGYKGVSDEQTDEYTDDDDDDDEGETESDSEDSDAPAGVLARGVTTPGQDDFINQDEDDVLSEERRLIAQGGMGIPVDMNGDPRPLLEPLGARDSGRKCLVLDLDETLVHSSFKMINNADFVVPVEIEGTVHNVYVIKRPGVDEFMRKMGLIYEVVVFTASLSKYADPVLDILDIHQVVRHRLFRESCYNHRGNYVKDLSQLGRPIEESIIIDNSPASYIFHPNNAVPISSWFNDPHDTELTDLCPFLADLSEVADVRAVLDGGTSMMDMSS